MKWNVNINYDILNINPRNVYKHSYLIFSDQDDPLENMGIVSIIPARWKFHPTYSHSFAMTEHYLIFIEQPVCFDTKMMMFSRVLGKPMSEAMKFYPNEKVRR